MASSTIDKPTISKVTDIYFSESYASISVNTHKGTIFGVLKAIQITFTTSSSIQAHTKLFKIGDNMNSIANAAVLCGIDVNSDTVYHFLINLAGEVYCIENIPNTVSMRILETYI